MRSPRYQTKSRACIRCFRFQRLKNPIAGRVPANASGYFKRSYRNCLHLGACRPLCLSCTFDRKLSFYRILEVFPYHAITQVFAGRPHRTALSERRSARFATGFVFGYLSEYVSYEFHKRSFSTGSPGRLGNPGARMTGGYRNDARRQPGQRHFRRRECRRN